MGLLFILTVGLAAGIVSGIVGTGSSIMLMPVLVYQYGPREAVPIMAVASVLANLSRILAWWREVDWRACAAYSVAGIPAASLGARTLLALPSHAVDLTIGLFLIAMVRGDRLSHGHRGVDRTFERAAVPVLRPDPGRIPCDRSRRLARNLSQQIGHLRTLRALTGDIALKGLSAGFSLMFGAFIAKRFVMRLEPEVFRLAMDAIMVAAGLSMLWNAMSSN